MSMGNRPVQKRSVLALAVACGMAFGLAGCVRKNHARIDRAKMLSEISAKVAAVDKGLEMGSGAKYSGGAGWVAVVALAALGMLPVGHWVHWKLARRRERDE